MIDRHYGHLARDGREHAIKLLDALNAPKFQPWTLVDAAWTSQPSERRHRSKQKAKKADQPPADLDRGVLLQSVALAGPTE